MSFWKDSLTLCSSKLLLQLVLIAQSSSLYGIVTDTVYLLNKMTIYRVCLDKCNVYCCK